jgi:hypothetical protein
MTVATPTVLAVAALEATIAWWAANLGLDL